MAGAATYSYSVRSDNRWIVVVVRVIIESFGVPFFLRVIVEIRIRKQPETQDACRVTIDVGINARRFWSHPLIQVKTVSVFCILIACLPKTRLINKP
jgi:hypothetical protein